ncbi:UNVERIFIED_CONTAM: putative mitochondrial protein [Sesamum latifolium]|uniref:Mitochondrial protein n=1 Tax=Sesamum latifolium TaxID=2727402 RepID=A0AAW2Y656_9LAMI
MDEIKLVKDYLHALFTIKDIGDARYFLGLKIARNSTSICVAQTKYVNDIITDVGLVNAKSSSTPLPQGLKLNAECGGLLPNPYSYRRLIGCLLYLGFTRSNIFHSVQQLSQFITRPCEGHWKATLHVVRYLKGCPSQGFFLPVQNSFVLKAYCDADWASCSNSRRSLSGFCIFLGDALAAIHITANPVFHERTNHIEMDCHIVLDAFKEGFIVPTYVRSSLQFADIFTKPLPLKVFAFLSSKLGLVSLAPSPTYGGIVESGDLQHQQHHPAIEDTRLAAKINLMEVGYIKAETESCSHITISLLS